MSNFTQQDLAVNVNNAMNEREAQNNRNFKYVPQVTPFDTWLNKKVAEDKLQKHDPVFIAEQAKQETKINAQGLAQALLGTKQVESMSYSGNPVKQSPDGKYWLENGQEVTDVKNIQTNNKFDPIAGSLQAMQFGNPLALQALQEQMKPKSGMDLADKLALVQAQATAKAEVDALKPKKDTDLKPRDINQFLTALGVGDYNDNDKTVLTAAAYEASDNPKKLDALSNALTSNSMHNYTPFMAKRWLSQDNFSKAMQAFQNK